MGDRTYCDNTSCPFKDCDRHYQMRRKAPRFIHGDIRRTLFPVKSRSCIRHLNVAY